MGKGNRLSQQRAYLLVYYANWMCYVLTCWANKTSVTPNKWVKLNSFTNSLQKPTQHTRFVNLIYSPIQTTVQLTRLTVGETCCKGHLHIIRTIKSAATNAGQSVGYLGDTFMHPCTKATYNVGQSVGYLGDTMHPRTKTTYTVGQSVGYLGDTMHPRTKTTYTVGLPVGYLGDTIHAPLYKGHLHT